MFIRDFITVNGGYGGEVGSALAGVRFDHHLQRTYWGMDQRPGDRRPLVTYNTGRRDEDGNPILREDFVDRVENRLGISLNARTAFRKDEWIRLDDRVIMVARERLRAWADLASASTYGGFDGMATAILEHETTNDPGLAKVDMDGLTEGINDEPRYQLEGIPLPITHMDFWINARQLAISRNKGMPINMRMAEAAGRRIAESLEQTLIGTRTGMVYGDDSTYSSTLGSRIYGYTNYPHRIIKNNLTVPTGANPDATVEDVIAMRELAYDVNYFGPFVLYHSTDWDQFLDNDYFISGTGMGSTAGTTQTLRERLRKIDGIQDVRRLDFLKPATNPYTLLLVQMTSDVVQAVNGMGITTVQWESMGGMRLNFKVMTIQVPRLFSDINGNTGIVHGTTA